MESFEEETTRVETDTIIFKHSPNRQNLNIKNLVKVYPQGFTYPMVVIYEFVNFRNNWDGVLPASWKHALNQVPEKYFQTNKNTFEQKLAVAFENEASDYGMKIFKQLLALGPIVRESLGYTGEYTISKIRRDHYLVRLVKAETTVYSYLESFKEWLLQTIPTDTTVGATCGKVFITQPIRTENLKTLEKVWVRGTLKGMAARVHELISNGTTGYMISVYSNVVCLAMLMGEDTHVINVINFLEPNNDVANAIKLGLFLNGSCREERKFGSSTGSVRQLLKEESTSDADRLVMANLPSKDEKTALEHPMQLAFMYNGDKRAKLKKVDACHGIGLQEQAFTKKRLYRRRKQKQRKPKVEQSSFGSK